MGKKDHGKEQGNVAIPAAVWGRLETRRLKGEGWRRGEGSPPRLYIPLCQEFGMGQCAKPVSSLVLCQTEGVGQWSRSNF